jgi:GNAT superfamily N-acetyltransferase
MNTGNLKTSSTQIKLIRPNIKRDSVLGAMWLEGEFGKNTLLRMGVPVSEIKPANVKEEKSRIKSFIERDDQLNWMIQFNNKVVGAAWVDLKPTHDLQAPAVHIMIGEPAARRQGVGTEAITAITKSLKSKGHWAVHSRTLTTNKVAAGTLNKIGFENVGLPYIDPSGLEWQNVTLTF